MKDFLKLSFIMGFNMATNMKPVFYKQANKLSAKQHKYKTVEEPYKVWDTIDVMLHGYIELSTSRTSSRSLRCGGADGH
jgi:hypothetical protein